MIEYAMNTTGLNKDEIAAARARFAVEDAKKGVPASEVVIELGLSRLTIGRLILADRREQ